MAAAGRIPMIHVVPGHAEEEFKHRRQLQQPQLEQPDPAVVLPTHEAPRARPMPVKAEQPFQI